MLESLVSTYIKFPRGDQLERVSENFQTKLGVPQCVEAIDGSHIPIAAPVGNHSDYYNRFTPCFYKVLLMLIIVSWTYVLDGQGVCMTHTCLCIHQITGLCQ